MHVVTSDFITYAKEYDNFIDNLSVFLLTATLFAKAIYSCSITITKNINPIRSSTSIDAYQAKRTFHPRIVTQTSETRAIIR